MNRIVSTALLAGAMLWAAPAPAEVSNTGEIWVSWDANRVIALATEVGDTGTLIPGDNSEPPSVGIVTSGGLKYVIEPTACNQGTCYGFQLTAEFDGSVTAEQMNQFNLARSFTKAYVDEGNAYLTRYEISDYGIPKGNFAADMTNFEAVAVTFETFLSSGQINDTPDNK